MNVARGMNIDFAPSILLANLREMIENAKIAAENSRDKMPLNNESDAVNVLEKDATFAAQNVAVSTGAIPKTTAPSAVASVASSSPSTAINTNTVQFSLPSKEAGLTVARTVSTSALSPPAVTAAAINTGNVQIVQASDAQIRDSGMANLLREAESVLVPDVGFQANDARAYVPL